MEALETVVAIVETIYSGFFAWMPLSLQILAGVLIGLSVLIMVIKVVGMIMDAIPFL